jgi:hypothetical protein
MIDSKNMYRYVLTIGVIILASYFGSHIKNAFAQKNDDYEMIRKYLLNDSPLHGHNRPKLWIHSKYEINARAWKSFYSRNNTDLNQPYIHLTVKTIIDHCGDDFDVCLIDDETFSRLIPGWDIKIENIAEPMRSHYRELGMVELIYIYGGMTIPNSFICMKNLLPLYQSGIEGGKAFVGENINRYTNLVNDKNNRIFTPDSSVIIGAEKKNTHIREFADYLKIRNQNPHFSMESEFLGYSSQQCLSMIRGKKMNLIGGEAIGVKTMDGKPVGIEALMEENFLNLCPMKLYGIFVPGDEILRRIKYQWFAVLSAEELLNSNIIVVKYLINALVSGNEIAESSTRVVTEDTKSVISI